MDEHIRNDCKSDAAAKVSSSSLALCYLDLSLQLYVNRCSYKGCKKKEVSVGSCFPHSLSVATLLNSVGASELQYLSKEILFETQI